MEGSALTRYVVSRHLEVESSSDDAVVMTHALLGSRLRLNLATQGFLELFKQPMSLDDLSAYGTVEKALPTFHKLRRAGFLHEDGHRENFSDRLLRRISPGLLGCPCGRDDTIVHDATFLGVPLDFGNTMGPGARFGPSALRRVSQKHFHPYLVEPKTGIARGWHDNDLDRKILGGVLLADAGDLFIVPNESPATVFRKLGDAVSGILEAGSLPVVVGGDHSITYPVLAAYSRPIEVIQIDAHVDLAEYFEGEEHHHGNFMSRALDLEHVAGVHQIGVRGTTVVPQTQPQGKVRQTLSPRELRRRGIPALVESLDPGVSYYVTFDIDALDPMYAPGTSTPQPGGLTFAEAKDLLVTIASQRDCVGVDLVEINPDCDHNDITAITGIELLLAFLGAHFGRRSAAAG